MNTIDLLGDSECLKRLLEGTISEFEDDSITELARTMFAGQTNLLKISLPMCANIGYECFKECYSLQSAFFQVCTDIGSIAFCSCSCLENINFPIARTIRGGAFFSCRSLKNASFPKVTRIDDHFAGALTYGTFARCSNLSNIYFPSCEYIGDYAFESTAVISADFSLCSNIRSNAFAYCSQLENASFPVCSNVGSYAFNSCIKLSSIYIPNVKYLYGNTFTGCSALSHIDIPMCEQISGGFTFARCGLSSIELPVCSQLGTDTFLSCHNLMDVYLSYPQVVSIFSTHVFDDTPMTTSSYTGNFGTIHVPFSLYESYVAHSLWAYYKDRFELPKNIISMPSSATVRLTIEGTTIIGSVSMTARLSKDLTFQGINVDSSIVTVSDISEIENIVTFNVNGFAEGSAILTLTAVNENEEIVSKQCSLTLYISSLEYAIESIAGATYGFELNTNNYYESKNKGLDNSYAICKLVFSGFEDAITLECINSGEANYDFGLISKLDTMLANASTEDASSLVFKSFKGQSSTSPVTVSVPVTDPNEHYLCIKFKKDGSQASGNDSLQFRVVEPV